MGLVIWIEWKHPVPPSKAMRKEVSRMRLQGWRGNPAAKNDRKRARALLYTMLHGERYAEGWLHAIVHLNPETGEIHTEGSPDAQDVRKLLAK